MYSTLRPILIIIFVIIAVSIGVFAVGSLNTKNNPYILKTDNLKRLSVGGTQIRVLVAKTPEERSQGLSGRTVLAPDSGMLFVFGKEGFYRIWMKDMNFPIDVYWIDKNGTIVDIWENADPSSYPSVFTPKKKALYVLEVSSGFSDIYNITIGSRVTGM